MIPTLVISTESPVSGFPSGQPLRAWRYPNGAVAAYSHFAEGWHWMHFPEVAWFRFAPTVEEVTAFPLETTPSRIVISVFERSVLPLVLHLQGREVLHASAVLSPRGAVAFCGDSGVGKSTLACALGRRGWPTLCDDTLAWHVERNEVKVQALPFAPRLLPDAIAWFDRPVEPTLTPTVVSVENARLAAVCLLESRSSDLTAPRLERLRSGLGEPLVALLHHAFAFQADELDRKRQMIAAYLALLERVPIWRLRAPDTLERLEETVELVMSIDWAENAIRQHALNSR
jgi:hypothetical protein